MLSIMRIIRSFNIFIILILNVSFMDAPIKWQLSFQAPATPIMEGINNFHNHIMFFVIGIAIFVFWLIFSCLMIFNQEVRRSSIDNFTHATNIEIIWTIIPAILLILIAIPSFSLLYSMDEMVDPAITLKIIGHQWYWSYEYSDNIFNENIIEKQINFDSYMIPDNTLTFGQLRLLEVDNRILLPIKTHIRLIITSADVLHSWAIPSFGIKVDACPGRLNQAMLYIKRPGVFYGQCSELCGANHGFMPIVVESVKKVDYLKYIQNS